MEPFDISKELAKLAARPDYDGLQYSGFDSSHLIFPHLQLEWTKLLEIADSSGKPMGDLGAGKSALSVEAELRGHQMIPVDIMFRVWGNKEQFVNTIAATLDIFTNPEDSFRAHEIRSAAGRVFERYCCADIAKLPFPDQHFSVAIAHDSVPKHALSLERFLDLHLGEMLRVTHSNLYVYPFACYQTDNEGELVETRALYNQENALAQTRDFASRRGFSFELTHSGEQIEGSSPYQTAIFRRQADIDLSEERFNSQRP